MHWMPTFISLLFGLLLSLSLTGCAAVPDSAAAAFGRANAQLRQGHYASAISQYRHLARQGVAPAALYCNLGTAYQRAGRVGWAIYYYEKALLLTPFDTQLLATRSAAQPPGAPLGGAELVPLMQRAGVRKAADAGIMAAVAAGLLGGALLLGAAARRGAQRRRLLAGSRGLLATAALLLLAGGLLLAGPPRRVAIVVVPTAVARSGPSGAASRAFAVEEGTAVGVEKQYRGWLKIRTTTGAAGWLPTQSVACLQP